MYKKYPRTMNCSFSQSESSDDVWLTSQEHFYGKEVVYSEKIDGENCNLYSDICHARSIDSVNSRHPSRSYVKQLHASIKHLIPNGFRVCGENVYAKHSISYNALPGYFLMFGVFNAEGVCLSWDEVEMWAAELGLPTVPVLGRGIYDKNLEEKLKTLWPFASKVGAPEAEGFVVRLASSFAESEFKNSCYKMVRPHHVNSSSHWMTEQVVPNYLSIE